ncbi:hypothetical protein HK098_006281 [Nowakowskiella sp. JEL0407]|nr:hypothetical protein HK098_006281 [Nowakowskiella sp. JEL0407]
MNTGGGGLVGSSKLQPVNFASVVKGTIRSEKNNQSNSSPNLISIKELIRKFPIVLTAIISFQKRFRRKREAKIKMEKAAIRIQAGFRSFQLRKNMLANMNDLILSLRNEIANKDVILQQYMYEVKLRTEYIDQLVNVSSESSAYQKQFSDTVSVYESRLLQKDQQIASLHAELKKYVESSAGTQIKNELQDTLSHQSQDHDQVVPCFPPTDSDDLLDFGGTEDTAVPNTANSDIIQDLQKQLHTTRSMLKTELALKTAENNELRSYIAKMQVDQFNENASPSLSYNSAVEANKLSKEKLVPLNVATNRNIWAPIQSCASGKFSHFSYEITSPMMDNGYQNRYTSFVDNSNAHIPKSLWNMDSDGGLYGDTSYNQPTAPEFTDYFMNNKFSSPENNSLMNFHYLVDKITKTNDQPASLLLQQKLKSATPATKELIFEAINKQSVYLMKNRFGNFLMQRCLEFGSPNQVRSIGLAMRGNMYTLSCDRFGCHVVQKALDAIDEELKAALISELFRTIPETITHRFACHVWQRIFEIKWKDDQLSVMPYVDSALRSQWHMIANDENGSLVVQCIFENCLEKEKVPIIQEILDHSVEIAKGQWGNWVIQHILEHGAIANKNFILKSINQNLHAMSVDQYASKVVEKALKVAPRRELYEMVNSVLSASKDPNGRPSILDMMNNQYANYVVQHILTLSETHQRESAVRLIAPHLVTLRGSKYGQRVASIVEKHLRTSPQRLEVASNLYSNGNN